MVINGANCQPGIWDWIVDEGGGNVAVEETNKNAHTAQHGTEQVQWRGGEERGLSLIRWPGLNWSGLFWNSLVRFRQALTLDDKKSIKKWPGDGDNAMIKFEKLLLRVAEALRRHKGPSPKSLDSTKSLSPNIH